MAEIEEKVKDIELKESLLKSVVYRVMTIMLGFTTALLVTGSFAQAVATAGVTEFVQFIFYFIFETVWTNLRTKKRLKEKLRRQMVDLNINYDAVLDLSYELSRLDTYMKEVYDSANDFFLSILKNPELKEIHDQVEDHYNQFKNVHVNRELIEQK